MSGRTCTWLAATRARRATTAAIGCAITVPIYGALNQYLAPRYDLLLPVDRALPLLAWTVPFYFSYFILVPLTAWRLPRTAFGPLLLGLGFVFLTCCAGFVLFPAHYPRPDATTLDSTFAPGVRWLYGADGPGNTFPSMHVAVTTCCVACLRRRSGHSAWLLWGAAITVSTLTVKQHFLVDVIAGLLVGYVAFWLVRLRVHPVAVARRADESYAPQCAP